MKKKITAIAAVTAILAMALSGTLAYLKTETNTVTNTFTIQGEGVHLYFQETDAMQSENGFAKDYVFVPGMELVKDPTVKLAAGSKPCYVFVKVVEEHNTYGDDSAKLLSYAVDASKWTALEGEANVYYRKVDTAPTAPLDLPVLVDNKVTVDENCTQDQLNAIAAGDNRPSITFNASAISLEGDSEDNLSDPTAAWNALNTFNS